MLIAISLASASTLRFLAAGDVMGRVEGHEPGADAAGLFQIAKKNQNGYLALVGSACGPFGPCEQTQDVLNQLNVTAYAPGRNDFHFNRERLISGLLATNVNENGSPISAPARVSAHDGVNVMTISIETLVNFVGYSATPLSQFDGQYTNAIKTILNKYDADTPIHFVVFLSNEPQYDSQSDLVEEVVARVAEKLGLAHYVFIQPGSDSECTVIENGALWLNSIPYIRCQAGEKLDSAVYGTWNASTTAFPGSTAATLNVTKRVEFTASAIKEYCQPEDDASKNDPKLASLREQLVQISDDSRVNKPSSGPDSLGRTHKGHYKHFHEEQFQTYVPAYRHEADEHKLDEQFQEVLGYYGHYDKKGAYHKGVKDYEADFVFTPGPHTIGYLRQKIDAAKGRAADDSMLSWMHDVVLPTVLLKGNASEITFLNPNRLRHSLSAGEITIGNAAAVYYDWTPFVVLKNVSAEKANCFIQNSILAPSKQPSAQPNDLILTELDLLSVGVDVASACGIKVNPTKYQSEADLSTASALVLKFIERNAQRSDAATAVMISPHFEYNSIFTLTYISAAIFAAVYLAIAAAALHRCCVGRKPHSEQIAITELPPWFKAVKDGDLEYIRQNLAANRGTRLTCSQFDTFAALHIAAYYNQPEAARLLFDHERNENSWDKIKIKARGLGPKATFSVAADTTALMVAILNGSTECVDVLLSQAGLKNEEKITSLMLAAATGDVNTFLKLSRTEMKQFEDVNSPIGFAAIFGRPEIIRAARTMARIGVESDTIYLQLLARDAMGNSPLELAIDVQFVLEKLGTSTANKESCAREIYFGQQEALKHAGEKSWVDIIEAFERLENQTEKYTADVAMASLEERVVSFFGK